MGNLLQFNDFEEKKQVARQFVIETKNEFDELFEKLKSNSSIWRGASEANHRLYTSLQRFWIKEDLPSDSELVLKYLRTILDFANNWNNGFLKRYLNNYHIQDYTIYTVLSILRHHETPTPILDWTRNPSVALFFGAYYAETNFNESDISNYFSLYEMKEKHPYAEWDQKNKDFEFWKSQEESVREDNNLLKDEDPDFIEKFYQNYLNFDELYFFEGVAHSPIIKIEDKPSDKFAYYINNNYNITTQEGLFILNISPDLPLELAIWERMKKLGSKDGYSQDTIIEAYEDRHIGNFYCYDIHKSLRKYALERLKSAGIDENYIYPNLHDLASSCLEEFMKKL